MRLPIVLIALLGAAVSAETIYFQDGTALEVPVGSSVYITEGTVWEYTRFDDEGMDLRPVEANASVVEVCQSDDGFTFGGSSQSCSEGVEVPEQVEECEGFTFGGSGC